MSHPYFKPSENEESYYESTYDRPIGIAILAVIIGIASIFMMVGGITVAAELRLAGELTETLIVALQIVIFLLGACCIILAIGIWKGKRWSWWIAMLLLIYTITESGMNVVTAFTGYQMTSILPSKSTNVGREIIKLLLNIWVLRYMMGETVGYHFKVTVEFKRKAVKVMYGLIMSIIIIKVISWLVLEAIK